eukprot:Pgem_evm1s5535
MKLLSYLHDGLTVKNVLLCCKYTRNRISSKLISFQHKKLLKSFTIHTLFESSRLIDTLPAKVLLSTFEFMLAERDDDFSFNDYEIIDWCCKYDLKKLLITFLSRMSNNELRKEWFYSALINRNYNVLSALTEWSLASIPSIDFNPDNKPRIRNLSSKGNELLILATLENCDFLVSYIVLHPDF